MGLDPMGRLDHAHLALLVARAEEGFRARQLARVHVPHLLGRDGGGGDGLLKHLHHLGRGPALGGAGEEAQHPITAPRYQVPVG